MPRTAIRLALLCGLAAAAVAPAPMRAQEPFIVLEYRGTGGGSLPSGSGGHVVAPGETLTAILRRAYGPSADLRALVAETVRLNPQAFRGGDPNRLLAGQRLVLPGAGGERSDEIYVF